VSHLCLPRALGSLVAGLGILLTSAPLSAQANFGRILGSVTDQTGGVIAGATVTVMDLQRGVSRTLITDQAGEYAAPSLVPGRYTVRAEANGFKTSEHTDILLEVGTDVRIDFSLRAGTQSDKITVYGEAPIVDITSATLGGTLSNQTINDLPLNGRNYQNLLPLRPGVVIYPGGGTLTQSTNGLRPDDNVYLIDGLTNNEPWTGMSGINGGTLAGDASTILPLDAIQEFNSEQNPRAEYGWKPGGVVNVGLKSGTNSLHGTAYAFGRDDSWDARNYFNPVTAPKYPLALEQFGATAGGPIKKDKIFWFLAYEGQRYDVGAGFNVETPVTCAGGSPGCGLTAVEPGVSLVDACKALQAAGQTISSVSARIAGLDTATCAVAPANFGPGPAQSLFPTNSGHASAGDPKFLPTGLISSNQSNNGVAKIDYHVNEHHALNGMYFIGEQNATFNDVPIEVAPIWLSLVHAKAQLGSGRWIWTPNSRWVNELMVGYGYYYQSFFSVDHNVPPTSYGINTGVTDPLYGGFPLIAFRGFNMALGGYWPKIVGPDGVSQFVDHVSYLRGKHAFKFGAEVTENKHSGTITNLAKGLIGFFGGTNAAIACPTDPTISCSTSLEDFLTGNVFRGRILVGNVFRETHTWGYSAFLQDDWHMTRRVTMNLGVRYEINTVLKEPHNLLANFDPNSPTGLVQVGKQISSPYNGDHTNIAPRLGLAWDVWGNGKTLVRVGGGVTYEQFAQQVFLGVHNLLGLSTVPTGAKLSGANGTPIASPGNIAVALSIVSGADLTPGWQNNGPHVTLFPTSTLAVMCGDGLPNSSGGTDPSPCTTLGVAHNLRTPYVSTWTLGMQQSLGHDLSLELAYVGNRGSRILGDRDVNQKNIDTGVVPYAEKFPYLQFIDVLSNLYRSNYNALQATLTRRLSHGLSILASYTYSHALDDASANWQGGVPLDSYHPELQYASSDFDVRHRFTLSMTYTLPGRRSPGQLLDGWQVNSIVTLQTGFPWAPQDFSNNFSGTGEVNNPESTGERWDFFGNPKDFTSGPNPIPCFGDALCGNGTAVPQACITAATSLGPGAVAQLGPSGIGGCFMQGNSVLIPPANGTYGTAGRNIFRDSGFRNWDLSVTKKWTLRDRLTAQFRAEFFNVLNHPNFANPYGGPNGYANNDPSGGVGMGCGCVTPDVAANNPVLGSGSNRAVQLGFKLIF
jgi:hypothetical protein